jgi:Ca2+-binding RTX toxin-like protein
VNVNGNDTINCDTGSDTIKVNAGNVTVNGSTGTLSFIGGGSGTATLNLKGGTTTASFGSGGATVNVAGSGTFTDGTGVETYNFTKGGPVDTVVINQFRVGTDHLHLNGYGSRTTSGASITHKSGGVSIRLNDGSNIRLNGVPTSTTLGQLFA